MVETLDGNLAIKEFRSLLPDGNWQYPPKSPLKDYNLSKYFAYCLLDEIYSSFCRNNILSDKPQFQNELYEFIINKLKEADDFLKSNEIFFRFDPESKKKTGSLFTDYKIMRVFAYLRAGKCNIHNLSKEKFDSLSEDEKKEMVAAYYRGLKILREMFTPEMTTDQAFQKAYEIVERYWWPEEQDITNPPNEETLNPE